MASFLDKFKVTTALDTNTTMDLSCQHITTSDWMQASPIYFKEMVPGESIDVNVETFTRLAALKVPTFGRGTVHNRAFFVPMRTIFSAWNDFITSSNVIAPQIGDGDAYGSVSVSTVPFVENGTLVDLICGYGYYATGGTNFTKDVTSAVTAAATAATHIDVENVDIALISYSAATGTGQTVRYFNLTNTGRRFMKLLHSLGYAVNFVTADNANAASNPLVTAARQATYSALPLYSWLKIMLDWYYPSAYVGDAAYSYAKSMVDAVVSQVGDVHEVTLAELKYLFGSTNIFNGLVNYDSDYFVSAFDNPLGSSQGSVGGNISLKDINFPDNATTLGGNISAANNTAQTSTDIQTNGEVARYTPASRQSNIGGSLSITQYGLDALKAVTDYMKRHQLVGARALDRFYARFGKSLSSEKMDRSYYIGAQNIPLQFGDVMSHADSDGANLGSYAGKGIGYGNDGNFSFSTDEYGFFVIISSIIPTIGYYQGIDRTVMHVNRLDYWTPEFDQLGNQAIAKKELLLPMNAASDNPGVAQQSDFVDGVDGIFGYTPRYAEYKIGRDKLTGDFRLGSRRIGDTSNAWHLMRNVVPSFQDMSDVTHSRYFVQGTDGAQYSRIFYTPDDDYTDGSSTTGADKFYLIHNFNVTSKAPMHALYDTYKFENEDEGAKNVVGDVNGVKVN